GIVARPVGIAAAGIDEVEEALRVVALEEVHATIDDVRAKLEGMRSMVPAERVQPLSSVFLHEVWTAVTGIRKLRVVVADQRAAAGELITVRVYDAEIRRNGISKKRRCVAELRTDVGNAEFIQDVRS